MRTNISQSVMRMIAIAGICVLPSCSVLPKKMPLSALGPERIGPVSCRLDSGGAKQPSYSNTASGILGGSAGSGGTAFGAVGLVGDLALLGMKELAEAPGQSKLNAISAAVGAPERGMFFNEMRRELAAAGYKVTDGGPSTAQVSIASYGVYKEAGGKAVMIMVASIVVKNPGGKWMWRSDDFRSTLNTAHRFDDYVANPAAYKRDFEELARFAAKSMINGNGMCSAEFNPARASKNP